MAPRHVVPLLIALLAGPGSLAHFDAARAALARTLSAQTRAGVDALHKELLGTDACYAR